MQKGFNSDITVKGKSYHVQTEDWGQQNPYIVTRVFNGGAVIRTIKKSYTEVLNQFSIKTEMAIKTALRKQHADTIDDLVSGKLEVRTQL